MFKMSIIWLNQEKNFWQKIYDISVRNYAWKIANYKCISSVKSWLHFCRKRKRGVSNLFIFYVSKTMLNPHFSSLPSWNYHRKLKNQKIKFKSKFFFNKYNIFGTNNELNSCFTRSCPSKTRISGPTFFCILCTCTKNLSFVLNLFFWNF